MAELTVLDRVKHALGITGNYQDETLSVYIDEIKSFMIDAGVSNEVVESISSAGVISRGVTDIWNYGTGTGKLSEYFMQRVSQLAYRVIPPNEEANNV